MTETQRKFLTEYQEFPKYEGRDKELMEYFRSISTGSIIDKGYHKFLIRSHPRANSKGYVRSSILMAETALGKQLPMKAVVHHINGNTLDDRRSNLIICENNGYHTTIHARINALKISGNVDNRPCSYCHQYDNVENMVKMSVSGYYHRSCMREYSNNYNHTVRRIYG